MKKEKTRKYVVIGTITIVLGILSFIVYQSYAYFKVNYTGNIINTIVGPFGSYEYAYTGTVQEFTVPATGYYEIETWGAGTIYNKTSPLRGGYGGYTGGTIYLERDEIIYIYIGGNGDVPGGAGWNGGGAGGVGRNYVGGHGATDVRFIKASSTDDTIWNESTSLRSRIMVAGGGGGFACVTSGCTTVDLGIVYRGNGGNLISERGTYNPASYLSSTIIATQTSGYQFGIGEVGATYMTGGGGGYYGGKSGSGGGTSSSGWTGGGGGSSYISGYSGVNSVQEIGGTVAQPLHTNNTLHYSGKYFIHGSMEAGVNTGNGKAKITYIGSTIPERTNTNLDNVRYIKSCMNGYVNPNQGSNIWLEIQAIKDGINVAKDKMIISTGTQHANAGFTNITDGDISGQFGHTNELGLQCITIDLNQEYDLDEVMISNYWNETYTTTNQNTLSVGDVNTTGSMSLKNVLHTYTGAADYQETRDGKRYTAWD